MSRYLKTYQVRLRLQGDLFLTYMSLAKLPRAIGGSDGPSGMIPYN